MFRVSNKRFTSLLVLASITHSLFWVLWFTHKQKTASELRDETWDRAGFSDELQRELRKGRPGHECEDYSRRMIERWQRDIEPNERPPVIWFKPSENIEWDI